MDDRQDKINSALLECIAQLFLTLDKHSTQAVYREARELICPEEKEVVSINSLKGRIKDAVLNAGLPEGFHWGEDAMESFDFGKRRAWEAANKEFDVLINLLASPDPSELGDLIEEALRQSPSPDTNRYLIDRGDAIKAVRKWATPGSRAYIVLQACINALRPFAAYADPGRRVPEGMAITQGSSLARRQLTMKACYDAAEALREYTVGGWRPTHRHKARGSLYKVLGEGKMQIASPFSDLDMTPMTIYEGEDGQTWVRPTEEFNDGRFEKIS